MEFQIQVKRTPTADWTCFGPACPDRNKALKVARQWKETILALKRDEPITEEALQERIKLSFSEVAAIRVVDVNGRQIWETQIGD